MKEKMLPIYLDCSSTTPMEPRVLEKVIHYMKIEYGNAASRTHEFGLRTKRAVTKAREQIAKAARAKEEEVIFTSGATESNNLAILGLAAYGKQHSRRHIVSSMIEHKSVLEPLSALSRRGFDVTLVAPNSGGWIDPDDLKKALMPDTLLVSIMQVNNETGVVQPIADISKALHGHEAFFHVDAAQGFGKDNETLQDNRIDLISVSGHKLYAPKGVGALIARRRNFRRPPLEPLMHGGGQEYGLRPGTLPVHLIVGLGLAAELAFKEAKDRRKVCKEYRTGLMKVLGPLEPLYNGDQDRTLPHVINLSFPGLDSEALMLALKNVIAISNGSACTSQTYELSHVLKAMGFSDDRVRGAIRMSWCHMTESPEWSEVADIIRKLY